MLFNFQKIIKINSNITDIKIPLYIRKEIKDVFNKLPTNNMEFGGVMCGNKYNNKIIVQKFNQLPSILPSKNAFSFNVNIIKKHKLYCGNKKIVGIWHTHPIHDKKPSLVDRKVSRSLKTIGCVITDDIKCFLGNHNLKIL